MRPTDGMVTALDVPVVELVVMPTPETEAGGLGSTMLIAYVK